MNQLDQIRDDAGRLPGYAWPGGYQIHYITADGGILCGECANREHGSEAFTRPDEGDDYPDKQWWIVAHDVHWEGPPIDCDHCQRPIKSEYGDPADPADDTPRPDQPPHRLGTWQTHQAADQEPQA